MEDPDVTSDHPWSTIYAIRLFFNTGAEWTLGIVEFPPRNVCMPKISSIDSIINSAHDLIYALKNPAPAIPLVTRGNVHNEALISLAEIFGKAMSSARPPRVPIKEVYPEKLQQVNQE